MYLIIKLVCILSVKIGVVSDLHLEFGVSRGTLDNVRAALGDADIILMPGDISYGTSSIIAAQQLFPDKPVCLVAGNHEFYGASYEATLTEMHTCDGRNVTFLNCDSVILNANTPVRVIACTLWTDFALAGNTPLALMDAYGINDFRQIGYQGRRLSPSDVKERHETERAWLEKQLAQSFSGITVVMTHHAPVSFAIAPRYVGDRLSPCFASRMEDTLLTYNPDLVVWGHTHHCVDRVINNTRFVSSQTGYQSRGGSETGAYGCVVDLARR